ncbi:MAG: Vancomycin resistance protein [Patescibacteria group bacterium]|nr:Vancomycin resistance protein [Patescibacteria group bacterium]
MSPLDYHLKQIASLEKSARVAFTKKHPVFLPIILESKRLLNYLKYQLRPQFFVKHQSLPNWFNITEHSSPLYRKYNQEKLDEGKIENIKIAIKNMDCLVIAPGQTFSFWKFVGRPSKKKGFKNGLVLSDGKLKQDIGGGLCQLSNLLAYMFACTECDFVERKHHSRDVFPDSGRTVPFASGATVFFNLIDLKVKNNYSFPLKINLRTTDTQLRGSLSAPVSLPYVVKLEEKQSTFIKSATTGLVYRCNELYRVFYTKITKEKIKEILLWKNTARVMYEEEVIKYPIKTLSV